MEKELTEVPLVGYRADGRVQGHCKVPDLGDCLVVLPSDEEGRKRDLTWELVAKTTDHFLGVESRREVEKQLQFEPSVQIEDKDRALDLAVWRLLGAFEKVITVICVGARVS